MTAPDAYQAMLAEVRRVLGSEYAIVPVTADGQQVSAAIAADCGVRHGEGWSGIYAAMVDDYVRRMEAK